MMDDTADGLTSSRDADISGGERVFLIADVRGYTRFTRERGDEEAAELAMSFAELARDAVEARGGRVVELRGDEALAVFDSAAQAVRAATELAAICSEQPSSSGGLALPVGIGIDAGHAVAVGEGFRGAALNMAARFCSQAAGGQVLVSSHIAVLAGDVPGITFKRLDPVELKGVDAAVELMEAIASWPARAAIPSRADEVLPRELERDTPLAGREHELSWLRGTWRQVMRGAGRVLIVSGAAGIGKTRLAAELATFVVDTGGSVAWTGAGGAAAADAAAALRAAVGSPHPALLVLDDLDATAASTAAVLVEQSTAVTASATLVLCLLRNAELGPPIERLLELADVRGDGHRRLGPLDSEGVRSIARVYAGDDVDGVPLEAIGRSSRGVPARVHESLVEWAQTEASRRLAAAAEFLAAERRHHVANLDFANTVIGLKLGRLSREDGATRGRGQDESPYKGLAAFGESDARLFFGRERLVGELAARTVAAGLLAVVGPSGSGKSSVIAAGLVPSLRAGLLPGSERWRTVSIRPGEHPEFQIPAGERVDERLVLIVDQFEETFTLCSDEAERAAFIARLVEISGDPDRAIVVLSLRGDYYGHCAAYPQLAQLMAANQVLVGPMSADELRRAIELPARRAGVRVESALCDVMAAEVGEGSGGLPLLSTALVELWHQRDGGYLRLATYERVGGLRGAVARLAESSYERLDTEQQDAARRLFLRLVALGDAGAVARRTVSFSELDLESDAVLASVVERLTVDRLLTAHESSIEVAHEALLREWPRFREWLAEDEQGRELRDHLIQTAKRWDDAERDDSELYRGARLSTAVGWAATRGRELNTLEHDFLAASQLHSELDAERQRRQNRRLRALLLGTFGLLSAAVAGGIVALSQRQSAQDHARVALSRQLGAEAIIEPRLDRGMLLAHEAVNLDPSRETSGDLLSTLLRSPAAIATFTVPITTRPLTLALSPGGRTLAVGDNQQEELLYDVATHRQIRRLPRLGGDGYPFVYTPDGAEAVTFTDPPGFALVDARSGRIRRRLAADTTFQNNATGPDDPILVTPDGHTALMTYAILNPRTQVEGQAYLDRWDLRTGKTTAVMRLHGARGLIASVLVDRGRRLVTLSYDTAITWDVATLRRLQVVRFSLPRAAGLPGLVSAISRDGREAAIPANGGSVDFVSLTDGRVSVSTGASASPIQAVAFTPDGRNAVTVSDDRQVSVWKPGNPGPVETFVGHAGRITALAISADSRTLFSSSLDGAVFEWDLGESRRFGRRFQLGRATAQAANLPYPPALAIMAGNGDLAVSPNSNAHVSIVSPTTLKVVNSLTVSSDPSANVTALAASPTGSELAVGWSITGPAQNGAPSGKVEVWQISPRPRLLLRLKGLVGAVQQVAWSPDGKSIAAIGTLGAHNAPAGRLVVWDATSGRVVTDTRRAGTAASVAFSPNSQLIASAWSDLDLVSQVKTGKLVRRIRNLGGAGPVAFAADGTLATGSSAGIIQLWNLDTGKEIGAPTQVAAAPVAGIAFDRGGDTFVTSGGSDGVAKLWSTRTLQQLGADLPGAPGTWLGAQYTPNGRDFVVVSRSSQGWIWPARLPDWEAQACRVAGRNLTREEWSRYVGGRSYTTVCR